MGLLDRLAAKDRGKAARARAAASLYAAAVKQARAPGFYTALGVPDTIDGRFELIVLHVHLVCRRLAAGDAGDAGAEARLGEGGAGAEIAQALFDAMFRDMDRNLREMGVGDPSIPRRIRAMIEAYYGRVKAYDAALAADGGVQGGDALATALARNVYNAGAETPPAVERLADYVRRAATALAAQPDLAAGRVAFPPVASAN